MERSSPQLIGTLSKHQAEPKLSFFVPSSLAWPDVAQNQVRWENLLRTAECALIARGMNDEEAAAFMRPLEKLIRSKEFQSSNATSIAIFHSPELTVTVGMSIKVPEQVAVADHFNVLPLVQDLAERKAYYVLALSKNNTRLYKGDCEHLTELAIPDLPKEEASVLNLDPRSPSLQAHGGISQGKGGHSTVVHGQGGAADWSKDELKPFFREIDRALNHFVSTSHVPLVLACVDYYVPIYREVNSYPHLLAEHISTSPDACSNDVLLQHARRIIEQSGKSTAERALQTCYEFSGTRRFSTDLEQIILAARSGQVESLFLAQNHAVWGRYDSLVDRVKVFDEKLPGSEDMLNLAAIETINTGGQVMLVPAADLPQGREIAAIFRYEPIDIDYVARMDQPQSGEKS